ncbi:MAG: permease [Armatimonadetes bacterium CG_4_10_14_3_um_filter_66_18]|nr:permease [Armatimonadota bacterium]PIU89299.1 MAG: permease [Armatimonadetes bacterium CG06_land_8_20_14_3_00_66_21]PIY39680.1 MAG: permease [Armatimonadetes bacterium CG_4_10_14_3_um_filter_66_18]PIZ45134.1 MAG: permease [Armatimonadetes bacterium CG_4_10_14_0_8_um_filter_66_14]NCO94927.1 permease [Armatimonadota bacterium]
MIALWILTGIALLASLMVSRAKTRAAVAKGLRMLWNITPLLVAVLAVVSLALAGIGSEALRRGLSGSGPLAFWTAIGIGSVALIPGFIAYPLAGVLRAQGASVAVLAAFITSLMMVGVLTLPVEARFFGWRVSVIRNALAFVGAIVVAALMGWVLT